MSRRQTDPERVLADLREAIREARGILTDIKAERRAVREMIDHGAERVIEQRLNAACKEAFDDLNALIRENTRAMNKHVSQVTAEAATLIRDGLIHMIRTGETEWLKKVELPPGDTNDSEAGGA